MKNSKVIAAILAVFLTVITVICSFIFTDDKEIQKQAVQNAGDVAQGLTTYEMSSEEVEELPSKEITAQTQEEEEKVSNEQEVESEGFELQGEIAYEGDRAKTWNVELGDYKGLTYYSQIDSRWANNLYTSINDRSQTIGSSGCGPTSAAMVVTATKGAITPDKMASLFAEHGYRSANEGTYLSAFRAIADEFNINYYETDNAANALHLLRNNYYVVVSVGNGLFTNGGHLMLLTGLNGNTISIYDPYLYSGKFETSTRRGKVTVSGNTVYCSVDNFNRYANAIRFFCYQHDDNTPTNNTPVQTEAYIRYVNTQRLGLNVRKTPGGTIKGSLAKGTQVKVDGTSGAWSHIISPVEGWVSTSYLGANAQASTQPTVAQSTVKSSAKYSVGKYRVTNVQKGHVLHVRTGAGTNYSIKTYKQLTANAKAQNKRLGNYYANGYLKGVEFNVSRVSGNWGLTPSGWVCLDYCVRV